MTNIKPRCCHLIYKVISDNLITTITWINITVPDKAPVSLEDHAAIEENDEEKQIDDDGKQENNSHSREPEVPTIKDTTDGAIQSKPIPSPAVTTTSPSPTKKQKKEKTPQLDNKAFDELTKNTQAPLQDVRKTRPKRPRTNRPTRAGITAQHENNPHGPKEEEKVDAGLDDFYKAPTAEASPSVGKGNLSGSTNSL